MLVVQLNGTTIHDNVELLAPTRGGEANEAPIGPLRIQGDHGAVAFRNIKYRAYNSPRPELTNLTYKIYKGKYEKQLILQSSHQKQWVVALTFFPLISIR
jgi:hypothetical protein